MSDEVDEMSAASAGSQPVAWAVLRIDGSIYDVYANEEEAKAIDEAVTGNHGVVTLCRSPTLTDEERQAMMRAMYRVVGADSAILWSLLERTK